MKIPRDKIVVIASGVILLGVAAALVQAGRARVRRMREPDAKISNQASAKISDSLRFKKMEEEAALFELARDPFTGQMILPEQAASTGARLNGILWDTASPLAIIDGEVVKVGDRIAGSVVIEIKKDRVILHDGAASSELRLSP